MTGYFGSKAALGLYQNIIAMMPPHDTYIETHLGGGAVMRNKPPARNNIAIDIDPEPLASFDCGYPVQKVNDCAHRYLRDRSVPAKVRRPRGRGVGACRAGLCTATGARGLPCDGL